MSLGWCVSVAAPWLNAQEGSSAARQSKAKEREPQESTLEEVATGPSVSCRLRLGCALASANPAAPPAAMASQTQERKVASMIWQCPLFALVLPVCKCLQAHSHRCFQVVQTSPTAQKQSPPLARRPPARSCPTTSSCACLVSVGHRERAERAGVKLGRKKKVNDRLDQLPDAAHPLATQVPG